MIALVQFYIVCNMPFQYRFQVSLYQEHSFGGGEGRNVTKKSVFILGCGEQKRKPLYWALLNGSFLFHRFKEDFEEIKVVQKNTVYVVMGRREEVKCEAPHILHLASDYVLKPWGLSVLLLGSVDGHILTQNGSRKSHLASTL